jgi:hypothetical protein
VIWIVAAAVVFLWPSANDSSLALKLAHFAVDPSGRLPVFPPPLPMGLGDDADAVTEHDREEATYYDALDSSRLTRVRMAIRDWNDPLEVGTQRQALIALIVLGALLLWRLDDSQRKSPDEPSD